MFTEVLMTSLWKTWELMSHHEYSYQASGVPLHTNEEFQEQCTTGAILKQIYPTPNHV